MQRTQSSSRDRITARAPSNLSRAPSMAAMASSAAVRVTAATASATRFGSKSKPGRPQGGVKPTRRGVSVPTSASFADGQGDYAPAPSQTPPPQVFNAASIKVR